MKQRCATQNLVSCDRTARFPHWSTWGQLVGSARAAGSVSKSMKLARYIWWSIFVNVCPHGCTPPLRKCAPARMNVRWCSQEIFIVILSCTEKKCYIMSHSHWREGNQILQCQNSANNWVKTSRITIPLSKTFPSRSSSLSYSSSCMTGVDMCRLFCGIDSGLRYNTPTYAYLTPEHWSSALVTYLR